MLDAFLLGAAAQSALVLSGLAVYLVKVPKKVVGAFAGFGAGALLAAIAFDLIPQGEGLQYGQLALWLLIGGGVFIVSDALVESKFGEGGGSGALGIVVGAVVDGIPESLIFRDPGGLGAADQHVVPGRGVRLEHPAGARPLRRPRRLGVARGEDGPDVGRRAGWPRGSGSRRPTCGG